MVGFKIEFQYKRRHLQAWLYGTAGFTIVLYLTISTFTEVLGLAVLRPIVFIFTLITSFLEDAILIIPAISFIVLLQSLQWRYFTINSILRLDFEFLQRDLETIKMMIFSN